MLIRQPLLPGIDDVSAFPPMTVNGAWQLNLERDAYVGLPFLYGRGRDANIE